MSDEKSPQPEQSTEEILASIRRIIYRNDPESGSEAREGESASGTEEPPEKATPDAAHEDDILDLTERIEGPEDADEPDSAAPAPSPEEETKGEDTTEPLELMDVVSEPSQPSPVGEAERRDEGDGGQEASPPPQPVTQGDSGGDLVSESTAAASAAALETLAQTLKREPRSIGHIDLGEGKTLEDAVREAVTPLVREWLDRNLPSLVERLVAREIQRMVSHAEEL